LFFNGRNIKNKFRFEEVERRKLLFKADFHYSGVALSAGLSFSGRLRVFAANQHHNYGKAGRIYG
jgi:hypothetical protein